MYNSYFIVKEAAQMWSLGIKDKIRVVGHQF